MKVYFLRHGRADREAWSGNDFDRPLTEDGVSSMKREARALGEMGFTVDRILTSPLTRARQTAEVVAAKLGLEDRLAVDDRLDPAFDEARLAEILAENSDRESLMLVGHEPSFSTVISRLTGGGRVVCKKGGVVRVDLQSHSDLSGELVWLLPPRVLGA